LLFLCNDGRRPDGIREVADVGLVADEHFGMER
jgi:hypothetical protein